MDSNPRLGRSPREGKGCLLQYSSLENSLGVTKNQAQLSVFHLHFHFHDSSVFNFLRNLHTVFQVAAPAYISMNSEWGFPSHPHQHLLYLAFLMIVILAHVKWYPIILFLICISLKVNNVEPLFMYLLTVCISFLGKKLYLFLFNLSVFWRVFHSPLLPAFSFIYIYIYIYIFFFFFFSWREWTSSFC